MSAFPGFSVILAISRTKGLKKGGLVLTKVDIQLDGTWLKCIVLSSTCRHVEAQC